MSIWILTGVDSHDTYILGVFNTKELAEIAKDLNEESYAYYNISCWEVKQ